MNEVNKYNESMNEIIEETTKAAILSVPGVMELLSEEFHNDIVQRCKEKEQSDD